MAANVPKRGRPATRPDTVPVNIRMQRKLRKRLRLTAKMTGTTMTDVLERLIDRHALLP